MNKPKDNLDNEKIDSRFVKLTETKPLTVFVLLLVIGLLFGGILFVALLLPWGFDFIKDGGDAGGFLQGAWGTAGSLAAAFVAIVLANQALVLTRRQNEDQNKQEKTAQELKQKQIDYQKEQDEKTLKLNQDHLDLIRRQNKDRNEQEEIARKLKQEQIDYQKEQDEKTLRLQQTLRQLEREQNHILQQNTPEYQIAYRAAMSSTKLDSLQIIIGSLERKKFRGQDSTVADILKSTIGVGDEFEIKREVKEELLRSRYIEFAAVIAEKMYGTNSRLEIETLASELIVSSKLTLDKLLINRLNKTIHNLVANCMEDIQTTLQDPIVKKMDEAEPYTSPEIYRFFDYELVKQSSGNAKNCVSKSAYYFVNVLFAQMRREGYNYGEQDLFEKVIGEKISSTNVPLLISKHIPNQIDAFYQGFCVVTPFDFQRQTLIFDLEFPDRRNTLVRNNLVENNRGRPDREVMCAINDKECSVNTIVFLDQIEGAKDSINKTKWLTFSEHLGLWESMQQLHNLIVAKEHQLEWSAKNFIEYVRTDVADGLSENEVQNAYLEKILPRYWKVSGQEIETALGRMSNYDVILLQAMKELQGYKPEESIMKSDQSINLRYFVVELLTMLKLDEYSTSLGSLIDNNVFQSFLKEHEEVISIVNELAKRPFFERPFYGWILPDFGMRCSLETVKSKPIGFIGVYYLKESENDFVFKPNSLYNWLTSPNLQSGPRVRSSVAIAI